MRFYHYTTKKGFDGIKNNHAVKGGDGPMATAASSNDEPIFWMPRAEQPQKSSWYGDQHAKGFYLTEVSPEELTNKGSAKMGINLVVDDDLYVFVFEANFKGKGGHHIGDYKVHDEYKSTHKYYITTNAPDGKMPIGAPHALWCGKASLCP
ncbi:hypothetical protein [Plastoroseomonas hellenica]|uniref:hypothetical protein n=1 Tax=Plastoroseomonas hellenica TaxID=2687306 RepID=UPI001BAA8D9A|nr:hypothetical protein [Plastoroseomonas hellenica]MBR0641506.1 hypothetical protein [Plastoroseomonas hellenica]